MKIKPEVGGIIVCTGDDLNGLRLKILSLNSKLEVLNTIHGYKKGSVVHGTVNYLCNSPNWEYTPPTIKVKINQMLVNL